MERLFDAVIDASTTPGLVRPLIVSTPEQHALTLDLMAGRALKALMLTIQHGFNSSGHVEVLGWGARWLHEQGMIRSTAEKAARELVTKGYVVREQGPQGVLGHSLGVVPPEVYGGPTRTPGVLRNDGRPQQHLTGLTTSLRGTGWPRESRCRVCACLIASQPHPDDLTYVIQRGTFLKIGQTRDLASRLGTLRGRSLGVRVPDGFDPLSPLLLIGTTKKHREHAVHQRFARNHVVGEWFRPDRQMMRNLADLFVDESATG